MKDYKRIRVLFSDHLGLARGKYQPINTAAGGEAKFCISLYGLTYDKQLLPAPGSGLLEGLPDVVAKYNKEDIRPSWEADTGIVIPDIEFKLPFKIGLSCNNVTLKTQPSSLLHVFFIQYIVFSSEIY